MKLTELMARANSEEALGQELAERRQAQIEELESKQAEIEEQLDSLRQEPEDLAEALRNATKQVAEEKGFEYLKKSDGIEIYERDANLLFLPTEPETYLLITANPESKLPKKKVIDALLINEFPAVLEIKMSNANQKIFMGSMLGGAMLFAAAATGGIGLLAGNLEMATLFGAGYGSVGALFSPTILYGLLRKRSCNRKLKKLERIAPDLTTYQGIEAVKQLEEM